MKQLTGMIESTSTTSNTISADLDNDELALSVAYRF